MVCCLTHMFIFSGLSLLGVKLLANVTCQPDGTGYDAPAVAVM